jgi:glycosyltransferase involved in cell wall biosynthesis
MKLKKVSIVTPSLNSARYIERCIHSVRNQSHQNIEHIVIDGGSTDATLRILKKYENVYNLKWISEEDAGMYEAINKGIQLATGEIIGYLNTDDAYFPWSIELAVKHLTYKNSIVFGDLCITSSIDNINFFYLLFYQPFNLYHYTFINSIGQPTVFLKKSVFDKIGLFDTSFRLIGDCEYWLRCAKNGYYPQKVNEVLAIQMITHRH